MVRVSSPFGRGKISRVQPCLSSCVQKSAAGDEVASATPRVRVRVRVRG